MPAVRGRAIFLVPIVTVAWICGAGRWRRFLPCRNGVRERKRERTQADRECVSVCVCVCESA